MQPHVLSEQLILPLGNDQYQCNFCNLQLVLYRHLNRKSLLHYILLLYYIGQHLASFSQR